MTGGAALAAFPAMSTVALGQDRPDGGGNGGDRQRDPAEMATAMLKRFDQDGDGALNRRELTQALTAMLQKRQGGRDGRGGGQGG